MHIELAQPTSAGNVPITIISEHISFTFKQPLQSMFQVGLGAIVMPCIGVYELLLENLKQEGFGIFDTPEGTKSAINPKHVVFYMSPKLGIYSFMFGGKSGVSVKATIDEITQLFSEKSPIIT